MKLSGHLYYLFDLQFYMFRVFFYFHLSSLFMFSAVIVLNTSKL
jgi:hypothetical protein